MRTFPAFEPLDKIVELNLLSCSTRMHYHICSAVFQLPEGKLLSYLGIVPIDHILDVPNAFLGLLFYSFIFLLEHFISDKPAWIKGLMLFVNSLAMTSSVILALALWRLRELCVLCISTHLINFALLVHCYRAWSMKFKTD